MSPAKPKRPAPWSPTEDELVIIDYLAMLQLELAGKPFNKSATRRALLPKLNNRSEGSIEMKRMNISAVLKDMNTPYIKGYKPAANYQNSLVKLVQQRLVYTDL